MKTAVISLKVLPNHKKVLQEKAVENGLTLSKYIISVLFPEQKIKKEFTPLPLPQAYKPLKQRLKEESERRNAPQLSQSDVENMVKRNKKRN